MNIRKEIDSHAEELDKPILHRLFDSYHMQSDWRFVARCTFKKYGYRSYESHRVWKPTAEGYALCAWLKAEDSK